MFDRQFFKLFRRDQPYNQQAEESWERYVRSGKAETHVKGRRAQEEDNIKQCRGDEISEYSEDENEKAECYEEGEFEAELVWLHELALTNEIHAYTTLKELQGKYVPLFIDSACYSMPIRPSDLPAVCFDVPGMLIEYDPSFPLSKLTTNLPSQHDTWKKIVCKAMATARQFNGAGVATEDNASRNYLVAELRPGEFQVLMVDLSQAFFKDHFKDSDDADDEDGWPYLVQMRNNPIALIMKMRVKRLTGHKIEIEGVTMVQ